MTVEQTIAAAFAIYRDELDEGQRDRIKQAPVPKNMDTQSGEGGGGWEGRAGGGRGGAEIQKSRDPDPEIQKSRDPEIQKSSRRIFPPQRTHTHIYIYIYIHTKLIENISTKATQNTPPPCRKHGPFWTRRGVGGFPIWEELLMVTTAGPQWNIDQALIGKTLHLTVSFFLRGSTHKMDHNWGL